MLKTYFFLLALAAVFWSYACAQDKWAWPKTKNQKILSFYPLAPKKVIYADQAYERVSRDREPTTKRPLPGEVASDDIDDYVDNSDDAPRKQNSPYPPGGGAAYPGNFGGFNQFPQFGAGIPQAALPYPGNPANGILVGPGGPTGIIGRPPAAYPGLGYPNQVGGAAGGFPGYPQSFAGGAINPNFPSYGGVGAQYPNGYQQFGGNGIQYPGGYVPQFTEGYGLGGQSFNGYPPGYGGYGQPAFDEYNPQGEGKSANVKAAANKKIDDKLARNSKKL